MQFLLRFWPFEAALRGRLAPFGQARTRGSPQTALRVFVGNRTFPLGLARLFVERDSWGGTKQQEYQQAF